MVMIRPFAAFRPPQSAVSQIACPPYDVVSVAEARALALGKNNQFIHVIRPEIDLPPGIDPYDDAVYNQGRENLNALIQAQVLVPDPAPCFYIYQQHMGQHVQNGLVACASVADYQTDRIKKHELTREDKEIDRTKHIDRINGNDEPVFLTYKQQASMDQLVSSVQKNPPVYDFISDDGVRHVLWVMADSEAIAQTIAEFSRLDCLYVADGHHRSAAASRIQKKRAKDNPHHTGNEEYNFFLSVIFPHNQMNIMEYNRVIKDLFGNSPADFLEKLKADFTVTPTNFEKPAQSKIFGMYLEGKWYSLKAKPESFNSQDVVLSLDVSILQNNLFDKILGIQNPRTDKRLNFAGGIRGTDELERLVNEGGYKVAFSLFPTAIDQLMAIADEGLIMPPKSTWFEPKLKSGLFLHLFA